MSRFQKWANKQHSTRAQVLALIPAGVILLLILPYGLLVICPSLDKMLGWSPLSPTPVTILVGVVLLATGFPFALWSVYVELTKGDGTPLPMMPTQRLLITGPFRYCRNPMALGTILAYIGLAVARVTPIGILSVILLGGLLLVYNRRVEERELAERFGEPYLQYKRQVPFIIPRLPKRG
jgi:protein-S-isoprenylcysteine O-methyltransferase Ste14